ncbi:MAG: glycosyltransferase [Clostridia bacterium]
MGKPKILVTYIESGMGHIMSAKSISDSLKSRYGDKVLIDDCYIMDEDKNKTLINFEKFLIHQTKQTNKVKGYGNFVFFVLETMGKQKFLRAVHNSVFKKQLAVTMEAIRRRAPDVVVSTHYFITLAANELKRRFMPDLTVVTYDPDNNVHVWWDNRSEIFITNNEKAKAEAIERGFKQDSVKQVFFTAREAIVNANESPDFYKDKYGIARNRFTVIIADGVYAQGKSAKVCKALLKTDKEMNIIYIAGKNKRVFNKFSKLAKSVKPNINLYVFEFVPEVYELYGASDVFVTKAGPNAIMDCLFMGTPIIVDYFPHPIEKATCDLFTNYYGFGEKILNVKEIVERLEEFSCNSTKLLEYRNNIKMIDKNKNGSIEIADIIMKKLKEEKKI